MQLRPLQVARLNAILSHVGDDPIKLPGTLLAKLWSDAGATRTPRAFWDVGDNTCRRVVDAWTLNALLEMRAARLMSPTTIRDSLKHADPVQYRADGHYVYRVPAKEAPAVALTVGAAIGNPDVFSMHVANCLNLNADYSASLLPVVRLLLDYQDGNRTAEQGRAYWRELRRMVAHYDAVTGKESTE
ncbi:hypothetical protein TMCBR3_gp042c [Caulobacter phage TMCBR3]|nr:hypothetical protein TMCBR3_gp042c [Caulobacter phage TMCBR3]